MVLSRLTFEEFNFLKAHAGSQNEAWRELLKTKGEYLCSGTGREVWKVFLPHFSSPCAFKFSLGEVSYNRNLSGNVQNLTEIEIFCLHENHPWIPQIYFWESKGAWLIMELLTPLEKEVTTKASLESVKDFCNLLSLNSEDLLEVYDNWGLDKNQNLKCLDFGYRNMEQKSPQAVCILTLRNNQPLCVQRRNSVKYGLPGGSIEPEESPVEAAVRELKEETGFEVEKENFIEILRSEDDTGTFVVTFFVKGLDGEPCPQVGEPPCYWGNWNWLIQPNSSAFPKHNQKVKNRYENSYLLI